jgi:hypothetical protein
LGEIFVEYTLDTENGSPLAHTCVFTLANGTGPGYVMDQVSAAKGLFKAGLR